MKKKIIIIVSIIVVLVLAVGGAYLIDKNRMTNNKPVIFSTWGYDYAPTIEQDDITEKVPNILEINTTENTTTASIETKENETIFIDLLDGWKYEVSAESTDRYDYAIKFFTANESNKMTLYAYKDMFGVCGTELEMKDITLYDGNIAGVGFYDGSERWTFINFGNNIVMQNEGLTLEDSNEALSMVKTIKFVNTHPGNIVNFDGDNEKVEDEKKTTEEAKLYINEIPLTEIIMSEDGQRIAYRKNSSSLYVSNVDGSNEKLLLKSINKGEKEETTGYIPKKFIDNNKILYTCIGWEHEKGCGIIEIDTGKNVYYENGNNVRYYYDESEEKIISMSVE